MKKTWLEGGSFTFGYHTQQYTRIMGSFRYIKLKLFVDMNKQGNIYLCRVMYEMKLGHYNERNFCKTWFLVVPFLLPVCQFVQPGGQESEGAEPKNAHARCYTEV